MGEFFSLFKIEIIKTTVALIFKAQELPFTVSANSHTDIHRKQFIRASTGVELQPDITN